MSRPLQRGGGGGSLGGGLCRAQEALKHRGSGSASSAVKNMKTKAVLFPRKKKGGGLLHNAVYTNGFYVKSSN